MAAGRSLARRPGGYNPRVAQFAVFLVFVGCGLAMSSWASRLVTVRANLSIDGSMMGLLLSFTTAGSVVLMPFAGALVMRFGNRWVIRAASCLNMLGLVLAGLAAVNGVYWAVAAALVCFGAGLGTWDVTMNLAGTDVERALGRSVMPMFHAGYSAGTVIGAAVGWVLAKSGAPLLVHFAIAVAAAMAAVLWGVANLLKDGATAYGTFQRRRGLVPVPAADGAVLAASDSGPKTTTGVAAQPTVAEPPSSPAPSDITAEAAQLRAAELPSSPASSDDGTARALGAGSSDLGGTVAAPEAPRLTAWQAWREPRTLLVGLVVLAAALAEGSAGDWLALGIVDSFHASEAVGIAGFAVFLVAMTTMRLLGTRLIDRRGRVFTLRLSGLLAIGGLALFGLSPWLPLSMVGAAVWGFGSALGFPIGMSAAADDPTRAAPRTSVVATIGYLAFIAGPPALGALSEVLGGYRNALLIIMIPVAAGIGIAQIARPPARARAILDA